MKIELFYDLLVRIINSYLNSNENYKKNFILKLAFADF